MTPTLDDLNPDFRDLLHALVDANVELLIVDAYALSFHGAPRASRGIDIFKLAAGRPKDLADAALLKS